jgi:hypothetical protein
MREFFRHNPVLIVVLPIIAALFLIVIFFKTCTHEVTYTGVVLSHNVTSDRKGIARYYTVARFEDGTIRSISGLKCYVVEVGNTVHYTQTELNK